MSSGAVAMDAVFFDSLSGRMGQDAEVSLLVSRLRLQEREILEYLRDRYGMDEVADRAATGRGRCADLEPDSGAGKKNEKTFARGEET